MLFRKIIYIGESAEGAVYLDTKSNMALSAPESKLLNTEFAGKYNRLIPTIIAFLILGGIGMFKFANPFRGYYSRKTLVFLVVFWLIECIGLVWVEQRALYKNVKEAEPTDKENFSSAMHGNLFWNNFGDKKVTIGKKIIAWLLTILVCLCGLYPVLVFKMYGDVLGKPIGWEIIKVILMGMMPGIAIIMVWQNNLIRFLKAVEKYKHGDIKYKDENWVAYFLGGEIPIKKGV